MRNFNDAVNRRRDERFVHSYSVDFRGEPGSTLTSRMTSARRSSNFHFSISYAIVAPQISVSSGSSLCCNSAYSPFLSRATSLMCLVFSKVIFNTWKKTTMTIDCLLCCWPFIWADEWWIFYLEKDENKIHTKFTFTFLWAAIQFAFFSANDQVGEVTYNLNQFWALREITSC